MYDITRLQISIKHCTTKYVTGPMSHVHVAMKASYLHSINA